MSSEKNFTLVSQMKNLVKKHKVLNHPFLDAARQGRSTLEAMQLFAIQEMFVSLAFPTMMAKVISKIPPRLESARYPLVVNLYEEAGQNNPTNSHPNLLRKLAMELGVEDERLRGATPLNETTQYLNQLFELCEDPNYLCGLAAIGFGNEFLVLFEYPPLRKACRKLGLPPDVLTFFDENIKADVAHSKNIEAVVESAIFNSDQLTAIQVATEKSLQSREVFYDGLCRMVSCGQKVNQGDWLNI
jgi:pyrroloquinoline quinone (PQQ) biosynthesis protein C